MTKWEYRTLSGYQYTHQLNELGLEGWELVNVAISFTSGAFGGERKYYYYFKRPIVE